MTIKSTEIWMRIYKPNSQIITIIATTLNTVSVARIVFHLIVGRLLRNGVGPVADLIALSAPILAAYELNVIAIVASAAHSAYSVSRITDLVSIIGEPIGAVT